MRHPIRRFLEVPIVVGTGALCGVSINQGNNPLSYIPLSVLWTYEGVSDRVEAIRPTRIRIYGQVSKVAQQLRIESPVLNRLVLVRLCECTDHPAISAPLLELNWHTLVDRLHHCCIYLDKYVKQDGQHPRIQLDDGKDAPVSIFSYRRTKQGWVLDAEEVYGKVAVALRNLAKQEFVQKKLQRPQDELTALQLTHTALLTSIRISEALRPPPPPTPPPLPDDTVTRPATSRWSLGAILGRYTRPSSNKDDAGAVSREGDVLKGQPAAVAQQEEHKPAVEVIGTEMCAVENGPVDEEGNGDEGGEVMPKKSMLSGVSGIFQSGVNLFSKRRQPQAVVEDTPTPDTRQQETIEPTAEETSADESEEGATSSEALAAPPSAGFFSKWFAKKTPCTEKEGDEGGALEQPQTETAADEPVVAIATAHEETSPKGETEGSEGEEETSPSARPAVLNHAIVPPPLKTSLEASLEDGELAAAELWKCCALGGVYRPLRRLVWVDDDVRARRLQPSETAVRQHQGQAAAGESVAAYEADLQAVLAEKSRTAKGIHTLATALFKSQQPIDDRLYTNLVDAIKPPMSYLVEVSGNGNSGAWGGLGDILTSAVQVAVIGAFIVFVMHEDGTGKLLSLLPPAWADTVSSCLPSFLLPPNRTGGGQQRAQRSQRSPPMRPPPNAPAFAHHPPGGFPGGPMDPTMAGLPFMPPPPPLPGSFPPGPPQAGYEGLGAMPMFPPASSMAMPPFAGHPAPSASWVMPDHHHAAMRSAPHQPPPSVAPPSVPPSSAAPPVSSSFQYIPIGGSQSQYLGHHRDASSSAAAAAVAPAAGRGSDVGSGPPQQQQHLGPPPMDQGGGNMASSFMSVRENYPPGSNVNMADSVTGGAAMGIGVGGAGQGGSGVGSVNGSMDDSLASMARSHYVLPPHSSTFH
ncbi:unnamed protein product [Vitrella brassicaformis CCMP3155]|uniref:Uncharacterized protein n=3 Tax=Vitrella brassicaformis TaxID=1169539 RepID=A0A0G4ES33_VITBC|nr:unnamed protein product [Vitrella brassicaformis CCMP3155]|eukprot:CEM00670.1 unnamed protein product [Vitrella brassicaformis CCMP3155]